MIGAQPPGFDRYEHRCLWTAHPGVNLHLLGPDCDEHLRDLIFRDWLRTHPDDRSRYAAAKRDSAADRAVVVHDILCRAGLT
jgi:GrpB-like predicted nucleotidyltransferase (UPF0157 family)